MIEDLENRERRIRGCERKIITMNVRQKMKIERKIKVEKKDKKRVMI